MKFPPDAMTGERGRHDIVLPLQGVVNRARDVFEWSARSACGDPGFESCFRDGHELSALFVLYPARQRKVLQW